MINVGTVINGSDEDARSANETFSLRNRQYSVAGEMVAVHLPRGFGQGWECGCREPP